VFLTLKSLPTAAVRRVGVFEQMEVVGDGGAASQDQGCGDKCNKRTDAAPHEI
jgi:hypothetical protein